MRRAPLIAQAEYVGFVLATARAAGKIVGRTLDSRRQRLPGHGLILRRGLDPAVAELLDVDPDRELAETAEAQFLGRAP